MKFKYLFFSIVLAILFNSLSIADEKKSGINFYTGMFDFSDDGKKASLYGIEHIKNRIV